MRIKIRLYKVFFNNFVIMQMWGKKLGRRWQRRLKFVNRYFLSLYGFNCVCESKKQEVGLGEDDFEYFIYFFIRRIEDVIKIFFFISFIFRFLWFVVKGFEVIKRGRCYGINNVRERKQICRNQGEQSVRGREIGIIFIFVQLQIKIVNQFGIIGRFLWVNFLVNCLLSIGKCDMQQLIFFGIFEVENWFGFGSFYFWGFLIFIRVKDFLKRNLLWMIIQLVKYIFKRKF